MVELFADLPGQDANGPENRARREVGVPTSLSALSPRAGRITASAAISAPAETMWSMVGSADLFIKRLRRAGRRNETTLSSKVANLIRKPTHRYT